MYLNIFVGFVVWTEKPGHAGPDLRVHDGVDHGVETGVDVAHPRNQLNEYLVLMMTMGLGVLSSMVVGGVGGERGE